jgi:hypothetical protein
MNWIDWYIIFVFNSQAGAALRGLVGERLFPLGNIDQKTPVPFLEYSSDRAPEQSKDMLLSAYQGELLFNIHGVNHLGINEVSIAMGELFHNRTGTETINGRGVTGR